MLIDLSNVFRFRVYLVVSYVSISLFCLLPIGLIVLSIKKNAQIVVPFAYQLTQFQINLVRWNRRLPHAKFIKNILFKF